MVPLCDTPDRKSKKKFSDHWADYLDIFKQFGVGMPPGIQPGESREAYGDRVSGYFAKAAEILCGTDVKPGQRPHFSFSTREWLPPGEKVPMLFEDWNGVVQWAPQPSMNGVHDNSAPPVQAPPVSTTLSAPRFEEPPQASRQTVVGGGTYTPPPAATPVQVAVANVTHQATTAAPPIQPPATPVQTAPPPAEGPKDWAALAEIADSDPEGVTDEARDANILLTDHALASGLTEAEIVTIEGGWAGVLQVLEQLAAGPAQHAASAIPIVTEPVKGSVVVYKGERCEVTSVATDAKTVTLKRVDGDKKSITGTDKKLLKVPFADLTAA